MQTLSTTITAVTVFADRALVVRTAKVELVEGEHHLVFEQLPNTVDAKSVQVSGLGDAILANVKFKKEFLPEIKETEFKILEDYKIQLADKLEDIERESERLEKEKGLLEEILKKITSPNEQVEKLDLDPEKWLKMMDFYRERLANIDKLLIENERSSRKTKNEYDALVKQLNQLGAQKLKEKNLVEVVVQMKTKGELMLELSYVVNNASWYPVYDLRVNSDSKKVNITYHAVIKQTTGENWQDVSLKISTAKPQIGGRHPELTPWRLNIYKHIHHAKAGITESEISVQRLLKPEEIMAMTNIAPMPSGSAQPVIEKPKAIAETGATAVFFNISGNHTIKNDGTEQKVVILIADFQGHFRYSTVPKLSPYCYLKASIKNETPYPFLAGEANIFLDNNFVATSKIDTVAPSEDFWAFLGIDEGIKVEYKLVKKYEKQEGGLISKKTRLMIFEYQTKIKNHKSSQEEIVIWDQLPIAENASIKVHLIEPVYKEDTETLKKNEFEALKWFYKLKPNEEIIIPFKFSVEYPYDAEIDGLY
ncbi:MAG: mucoidy inhibitor MuiA [Flammeovirgaceae bacterium]